MNRKSILIAAFTMSLIALSGYYFGLFQDSDEVTEDAKNVIFDPPESTVAIVSGRVTPTGRPLVWKSRDRRLPNQEYAYFDDGDYSYTTIITAGETEEAWGGVNSAGFVVVNSTSWNFPDTVVGPDDDGIIMKLALQICETVDDFYPILDSTNITGRTLPSNYIVMDASGRGLLFECTPGEYFVFDLDDEEDAPDGFMIRAN